MGNYVIVGGSSGIGKATALLLQSQGNTVLVTGRNPDKLQSMADLGFDTQILDARDSAQTQSVFASLFTQYGRIDGVVHCAGSIVLKPAHLLSDEEFNQALEQNLGTAFRVLRASVQAMSKQEGGGSLVFCSSVAAQRGLVNHEAIAAAKAGVEGLALAAAASYARFRIRVNCVAPGLVRTELSQSLVDNPLMLKASVALHPLGRIGEAAEIAEAIAWLLHSQWVSGQVIAVDGGMSRLHSTAMVPK